MAIGYTLGTYYSYNTRTGVWSSGTRGAIGYDSNGYKYAICQKVTITGLGTCTDFRAYFSGGVSPGSFYGKVNIYIGTKAPDDRLPQDSIASGTSVRTHFVSAYGDVSVDVGVSNISSGTYYVYISPGADWTDNYRITVASVDSFDISGSEGGYDYYWQYQYYTKSTNRVIGTSSVYSETGTSSSAGYNVAVSDIDPYSNTSKTNIYTPGRYCGYANGFFTIYTTSSQASPAICYVQVDINTFTWHGSDTMDNNLIKPLASIRTGLTATAWNRFQDIMVLVGNASQAGVSAHKTSTGSTVTAALLKSVLTELGKIESQQHTGITIVDPQTIVKNQTRVLASYFNGTNSIKDNLNNLVDSVNS